MKKPTPWPWNVVEAIEIMGADGIHVATVRPTIHWNELANVSLIAAAPELLEALKQQCPCECRRDYDVNDEGQEQERFEQCRRCAAIAKAEGGVS